MNVVPKVARESLPSCTVLICTRNRPAELARCLEAVRKLRYPDFEVLIVDSAPADTRTFEIALARGVRYLMEPTPGISRARNVGAHACRTEIVAMIDDDAVPQQDWLLGLVRELSDPSVMAVAGRILSFDFETEEQQICGAVGGADCGEEPPHGGSQLSAVV